MNTWGKQIPLTTPTPQYKPGLWGGPMVPYGPESIGPGRPRGVGAPPAKNSYLRSPSLPPQRPRWARTSALTPFGV